jgi:hypothetical protein
MNLYEPVGKGFELLKVKVKGPWKSSEGECALVRVYFEADEKGHCSVENVTQYLDNPGGKETQKDKVWEMRSGVYRYQERVDWTVPARTVVRELRRLCRNPEFNPSSTTPPCYVGKLLGCLDCLWG